MKAYKLVGYHPYWINNSKIINFYQIEEILNQVNISNPWVEIPSNNFNWTNVNYLTFIDNINSPIEYIRIESNGNNFYYKKIKNEEIGAIDKKNNLLVTYHFELDEWNTYIFELLNLLLKHHCLVHFKRCFLDRLLRIGNKYILNFKLQKYLKDIIPLPNLTNIREFVNGTNARAMYEINNPTILWDEIPESYTLQRWDDNTQTTIIDLKEWFASNDNVNGDNHRFCYIVAKSSALRKIDNNQKNLSVATTQDVLIIPLPATHKDTLLHGINDINTISEQPAAIILGDSNIISSKLVELPYTSLFDWYTKNTDKASFQFAYNKTNTGEFVTIPFFKIKFNQPLLFNIFDYLTTNSNQGIGKKVRDLVNNLDKLIPTTEPLLLNSAYYYELYNNGLTQYSVSFDNLHLEFAQESNANIDLKLSAYFNFFSNIDMSFYFGEKTNIYQTDLDNTNTKTIDISIPFGLANGASSVFLENNLNTGYTNLLNRQSEKGQAIGDATFNCAITAANAIGYGANPLNWFNPGGIATKTITSTLQIAKTIMDTTMEQQRADNSFYASIKNSTQAPSNINTSPFSKANIPLQAVNGNYLMMMYAIIPNQQCIDKIFSDYLHNAYLYDADDDINKFINRKYMNVLSISPNDKIEDILAIWEKNYKNKIFNNKYWFTRALSFLGETHSFYMTPYLVNVTNYKAHNYIHNIEIEPYNIIPIKIPINDIITTRINRAPKCTSAILSLLIEANPQLDNYLNDIDLICDYENNYLIINAKENGNLIGQITFYCFFYTSYFTLNQETYYVNKLSDLCANNVYVIDNNYYYDVITDKGHISLGTTRSIKDLTIINEIDSQLLSDFEINEYFLAYTNIACYWTEGGIHINIPTWINTIHKGILFNTHGIILNDNDTIMSEGTILIKLNKADIDIKESELSFSNNINTNEQFMIYTINAQQTIYLRALFLILPNVEYPDMHRNISFMEWLND